MGEDRVAAQAGHDAYGVARVIALSDGIFAIATTLLVLDLPIPQLLHATNADLLNALVDLRPNFASFVLSFVLVGLNWINHHRLFRGVVRTDPRLMQLNLAQLLVVCLVPFTAALLARYGELATAVVFYASNLCLMGILSTLMRLHLMRAGLLDPDPGPGQLRRSLFTSLSSVAVFGASIPIAFWNPNLAEFVWLALIPLRVLLTRLPSTKE
ncbi:MAG TPA: TMEM175 family protein [Chloroflexota bacterium]|nr:TMEM175 family protein [Chloroflexota bacterium]